MSKEICIESMNYLSNLYKDPYCTCDLYELEGIKKRVFKIKNEELQQKLIPIFMRNQISFTILGDSLCMFMPYETGISLLDWMQQSHSMLERIKVCKEILFHLIASSYQEDILELCLDLHNIAIGEQQVLYYFDHPNFARYLFPPKSMGLSMRTAQLFLEIFKCDTSIHQQNYLKNPIEYQKFEHKIVWKRYRSYDAIMNDIVLLEKAYQSIKNKKKDYLKYIIAVSVIGTVIILLLFAYFAWQDHNAQTYDGIHMIGNEKVVP